MRVGWTPHWLANSLTVRSPLRAAKATWALNAAVCCFRLPAIVPPFLGHQSSLAGGPVFGVLYVPPCAAGANNHVPTACDDTTQPLSAYSSSQQEVAEARKNWPDQQEKNLQKGANRGKNAKHRCSRLAGRLK